MSKTRKPKRRSPIRCLLIQLFRLTLTVVVLAVLWVGAYRFINPPGGVYIAQESARLGGVDQRWRALDEIAPDMVRAVIAAEDARFCEHWGFDFDAIEAALAANLDGRRLRGGSTISQQVAKNAFLWHERSWVRKGLEAVFTVLIEALWPKKRIVEVYLNMAEFGEGVFGIGAASERAFSRPAGRLSLTQASRLAAVLPNPKSRRAEAPSDFVRTRGRAIAAGARTIDAEGRDHCVFG